MNEPPVEPIIRPDEWVLFAAVIGGCFGSAIASSLFVVLATPAGQSSYTEGLNTFALLGLISFEIFAALLAMVALAAAGWRSFDFPFRIDGPGSLAGIALAAFLLFVDVAVALTVGEGNARSAAPSIPGLSLSAFLLVCIVNPLFEEVFVLGFVVRFFERRETPTWRLQAVVVSVAIRTAYHLYQGLDETPFHLLMGSVFAAAFQFRRNLWPFVLAHIILDMLGLYGFVQ